MLCVSNIVYHFNIYSHATGLPKKTPNGAVIPCSYEQNFEERMEQNIKKLLKKYPLNQSTLVVVLHCVINPLSM